MTIPPTTWSIQDAKGRLADLIDKAEKEGPQMLAKRGKPVAVVLSVAEHERLRARQPALRDWLLGGPKIEGLEVAREPDVGRDVDLGG